MSDPWDGYKKATEQAAQQEINAAKKSKQDEYARLKSEYDAVDNSKKLDELEELCNKDWENFYIENSQITGKYYGHDTIETILMEIVNWSGALSAAFASSYKKRGLSEGQLLMFAGKQVFAAASATGRGVRDLIQASLSKTILELPEKVMNSATVENGKLTFNPLLTEEADPEKKKIYAHFDKINEAVHVAFLAKHGYMQNSDGSFVNSVTSEPLTQDTFNALKKDIHAEDGLAKYFVERFKVGLSAEEERLTRNLSAGENPAPPPFRPGHP